VSFVFGFWILLASADPTALAHLHQLNQSTVHPVQTSCSLSRWCVRALVKYGHIEVSIRLRGCSSCMVKVSCFCFTATNAAATLRNYKSS
jgi:hypothetical protein